jgi:4-alpha-glucanotransferase
MPSSTSWGIGEIPDVAPLARWLFGAGQSVLQLLPIQEMPLGETSPYSALSAMAIDPQFIAPGHVEDVTALGGEHELLPDERAVLERLRASARVVYPGVRQLKQAVFRRAWLRFLAFEVSKGTARAHAFDEFCVAQTWWLDDYALYRALHTHYDGRSWLEWPQGLKERKPDALAAAAHELRDEVRFRQYLQWLAHEQWADVRRDVPGVALFGDLPFTVATDSADVWVHQHEFRLDLSVGAPPDAFSATGQDWNLPAYRWDVIAEGGFTWLRQRARRYADLYDGFRVDHLVGFYRTYVRRVRGTDGEFMPAAEDAQIELGERVLGVLREAGAEVTAEDLGVIPDFVRMSLRRLGVPGYKVFRWEREWNREGQPFVDPATYPATAVATTGTHDTDTIAAWWASAPAEERAAVLDIPSLHGRLTEGQLADARESRSLTWPLRDAILEMLIGSGSDLVIVPIQDVFGWTDRINQPATIGDSNWSWQLPWDVDAFARQPEAVIVAARLRDWTARHGR